MESVQPSELVALLRGPTLRVRTGLWLMPPARLGQEANEAARLGIDAVDVRRVLLAGLPPETLFVGLSSARVMELLEEIVHQPGWSDCVLVYNFDLLLARLRYIERNEVWRQLYSGFPNRSRALLIVMPANAEHLLPSTTMLTAWRRDRRLAE